MRNTYYFQHAIDCGINMTGKLAVPVEDSAGLMLMHPITHPETNETRIPTGVIMDCDLMDVCHSIGVDYVIVLDPEHTIFKKG